MQLNGISLISYDENGNQPTFVLECDLKTALDLDGQTLTITAGKDEVAVFTGYRVLSVAQVGKYTHLRAMRTLDPDTAGAISDLQSRYEALKAGVDANTAKLADTDKKVADTTTAATDAKTEAGAAKTAADEAKAAATTIQAQLDALAGTEAK